MTKAKGKGSKPAKPQAAGPFVVGDRVRVLGGEWGNSRGAVAEVKPGGRVMVQLGPRIAPVAFEPCDLVKA